MRSMLIICLLSGCATVNMNAPVTTIIGDNNTANVTHTNSYDNSKNSHNNELPDWAKPQSLNSVKKESSKIAKWTWLATSAIVTGVGVGSYFYYNDQLEKANGYLQLSCSNGGLIEEKKCLNYNQQFKSLSSAKNASEYVAIISAGSLALSSFSFTFR